MIRNEQNRTVYIKIYVTPDELERVQRHAEAARIPTSSYSRSLLLKLLDQIEAEEQRETEDKT